MPSLGSSVSGSYGLRANAFEAGEMFQQVLVVNGGIIATAAANFRANSLYLHQVTIPVRLNATRYQMFASLTVHTGLPGTLSMNAGLYTISGSTASLASSASRALTWASGSATSASSVAGGVSGLRNRTISVDFNLTPGVYGLAYFFNTSSNGSWSFTGQVHQRQQSVGNDANLTNYWQNGEYSASVSAFPASIHQTEVNNSATNPALLVGTFLGTF
jgi:hypothetical protein